MEYIVALTARAAGYASFWVGADVVVEADDKAGAFSGIPEAAGATARAAATADAVADASAGATGVAGAVGC